ncbi:3-phosphoshikimate 1-carboxyvinyltransferase [Aeromicrobium marinum DSM 15272]|uniref:3-phosphoshikimate 1-carboxyvinyltransferase n=1 Tax=Aeromicrobium marinum DSM 15272 TaxID=585531 RepID=E2SCL1_9ACTN|nr:3-phosphoshikimate 1-carboxyvinyltransferase [Aeromicrobium marinum]EFQ82964.1 3-phosphoshikimate 1-carboxyvinyltransferase [Aeromicrobium marinum DSM 15272]
MTEPLPWLAPHRDSPVVGRVIVPGSKSLTNRALVLAAVADGPSTLRRALGSRDTSLMIGALTALGAEVTRDGLEWTVRPLDTGRTGAVAVDCGLAGTVMRFVPALAALGRARVTFDGDERARERPMATTIGSLRRLGVEVDDRGAGSLPFTVHGQGGVRGGRLEIDASASSQFVSALLLAAPRFVEGLDLHHTGDTLPSAPHIAMTVAQLRDRGVVVHDDVTRWRVEPGPVAATDLEIEPDLSNAGVFVAAALVTAGEVTVRHWPAATDQAGDAWRTITEAFGGTAHREGDDVVFTGPDRLAGVDLDLRDVGELAPVVAAVAAFADRPSTLRGIAHLRGHETDRLAALATEINRLGGDVSETPDGLEIRPRPLHGDVVRTYHDHRMAHAAVVLALRVPDVFVENVVTTVKTYPNFAPVWERLVTA